MSKILFAESQSFEPRHKPFPYQYEAFEAIKELEYCAILHEQGLGKTKIALDLMLNWLSTDAVDSVILVVKKGLIANWQKEIAAHTNIKPRLLTQKKSENYYAFNSPVRLYLTHFETVKSERGRLDLFCRTRRVGVIIDEVQKIKNPNAELTKAFFGLSNSFSRRAIMTGTIVANRPYDIWAPIHFLDNGESLGSNFDKFKQDFDFSESLSNDAQYRAEFERRVGNVYESISNFSVRETKDGAGIDLPKKIYRTVYCDWETVQFELYQQIRNDFCAIIHKNGQPSIDEAESILKRLLRLVQIASNPGIVDSNYTSEPGKLINLKNITYKITDNKEKAIVWTTFTENADWLHRKLATFGTVKVHGKLSMEQRNKAIEKFCNDDATKVLIATPGAAKEGLTLTVANHVIFYDRSFSLDDYLQSQDRIHRISQERVCYVYNLIMQDSIDEWVNTLLAEKELAAKLAHGDIEINDYSAKIEYNMFSMLKAALGIEEGTSDDLE